MKFSKAFLEPEEPRDPELEPWQVPIIKKINFSGINCAGERICVKEKPADHVQEFITALGMLVRTSLSLEHVDLSSMNLGKHTELITNHFAEIPADSRLVSFHLSDNDVSIDSLRYILNKLRINDYDYHKKFFTNKLSN